MKNLWVFVLILLAYSIGCAAGRDGARHDLICEKTYARP